MLWNNTMTNWSKEMVSSLKFIFNSLNVCLLIWQKTWLYNSAQWVSIFVIRSRTSTYKSMAQPNLKFKKLNIFINRRYISSNILKLKQTLYEVIKHLRLSHPSSILNFRFRAGKSWWIFAKIPDISASNVRPSSAKSPTCCSAAYWQIKKLELKTTA